MAELENFSAVDKLMMKGFFGSLVDQDKADCESHGRKMDNFKEREHTVSNDIYSLAFAALIDPEKLADSKEGYLQPIDMTASEYNRIFLGALFVVSIQLTVVFLIANEMLRPGFKLKPATEFLVVLPRLISSILMHLVVEPDIRNGISIMKYVVNHPGMIRNAKGDGGISASKVFPAFFLGLSQAVVGITIEYMVIIYLSSMTSLMDIIMKFASLTTVI